MTPLRTLRFTERAAAVVLAALLVIVLFQQARLLYVFPQPDSARWWGDETGQMLELRAELHDGYARLPTGLGSSVAITNGLVRGNSWLAAAVYGVPAILFSKQADLVTIGRTATFILSILLLLVMFALLQAMHVPRLLALFAMLLLVTTRSFFFASHAARLDIAAGLALLVYTWFMTKRYERFQSGQWEPSARWYFVYGVVAIVLATLSIHLLTLVGALSVWLLWRFGAYRHPVALLAALGGVIAMLALLLAVYARSGAPLSLFGPSSAPNQFQSVAGGLPILRPLSRSVQVANILERLHGFLTEAPGFLALVIASIILRLGIRRSPVVSARERWLFGSSIVVALGWLLLQSPALYYYMHVIPLFIATLTTIIAGRLRVTIVATIAITIIALCLSYFALRDVARASELSTALDRENHAALFDALNKIEHDATSSSLPIVLAQNPAIAFLEHSSKVRMMTAHLVSFPVTNAPIADVLKSLGVNYFLLYAAHDGSTYSADDGALRPLADSLGTIELKNTGTLFDVHRDYFAPQLLRDSASSDTLLLYKFPTGVR